MFKGFFESLTYHPDHPLLFNSVLFFMLFTVFYIFYILAFNKVKTRNLLLLLFSLFFYYKVSGLFVLMLIFMASSDYFIGLWIYYVRSNWIKKSLVALSLIINLGGLSYFKYINFLTESFGIHQDLSHPFLGKILLPIGLSYFVFKTLTYIFDLYREIIEEPEKSYVNYLLYVSFFPNILAGPISKARDLLPQISSKLEITEDHLGKGFFLILSGAFKKLFLSDYLEVNFVGRVFDNPSLFSGFENFMASVGATMQIYLDFSGYTDIVIGLALLMGFTIMPNFNKPFLAQNVTEFWRRWHISLSRWMSDYLFYPLSYSFRRMKMFGAILAVLLTFFISGIWHGPNWTFILWGTSHGVAMSWDILTQNWRIKAAKKIPKGLYSFFSILITFFFLSLSTVLFRSADMNMAKEIYISIFTRLNPEVALQWVVIYYKPLLVLVLALVLHYLPQQVNDFTSRTFVKMNWALKVIVMVIGFLLIYQTMSSEAVPFVYLEF